MGIRRAYEAGVQHALDRLVVDKHCIITEGQMRIAYPGALLKGMGYAVEEDDAYYLYETRSAIVWPIDDNGLIVGEDSYTGADGFAGIENPLFYKDNTRMLFGDAKESIATLVREFS